MITIDSDEILTGSFTDYFLPRTVRSWVFKGQGFCGSLVHSMVKYRPSFLLGLLSPLTTLRFYGQESSFRDYRIQ